MTSGTKRHRGRGLSGLQARYVLGRLCGKSKRRAALDAGYGEWTAESAARGVAISFSAKGFNGIDPRSTCSGYQRRRDR